MIHISNVWKTKLNQSKYKKADPEKWLIGNWRALDPEFAGRLAYYAMCMGKPMILNETFRDTATQTIYYKEYIAYKASCAAGHCVLGAHGIKLAAAPGSSAHEYRLATDIDKSHPLYKATNTQLKSFGLCKPLYGRGELWHVQPIETNTTASSVFREFAPVDLAPLLKAKFRLEDSTIAYLAGYEYAEPLFEGLLAGRKAFSPDTITYIRKYEYGIALASKLGVA